MSYTFDTAWIIAQMIRTRSEATKALIRRRLPTWQAGREGRENFETFCWAWKHDCLASTCRLPPASHDPYPYIK
jgi:hypothetical protein